MQYGKPNGRYIYIYIIYIYITTLDYQYTSNCRLSISNLMLVNSMGPQCHSHMNYPLGSPLKSPQLMVYSTQPELQPAAAIHFPPTGASRRNPLKQPSLKSRLTENGG